MADIGYIQVHAFAGNSQIPLKDVAVTITDMNGSAIAMRLTNRSGLLDEPITITTPGLSSSLEPDPEAKPYALVNLYARIEDYEAITINQIQIFSNTITLQNLEMIPLSEFPNSWNKYEQFNILPQNL